MRLFEYGNAKLSIVVVNLKQIRELRWLALIMA